MPKEGRIENAFLLASIRIQQINVERIPGVDFFTKALPRTKYDQFHRYIVVNTDFSEEKKKNTTTQRMKTVTMDKTL